MNMRQTFVSTVLATSLLLPPVAALGEETTGSTSDSSAIEETQTRPCAELTGLELRNCVFRTKHELRTNVREQVQAVREKSKDLRREIRQETKSKVKDLRTQARLKRSEIKQSSLEKMRGIRETLRGKTTEMRQNKRAAKESIRQMFEHRKNLRRPIPTIDESEPSDGTTDMDENETDETGTGSTMQ